MCTALHIAFRTLEQTYRNFEMLFESGLGGIRICNGKCVACVQPTLYPPKQRGPYREL
ncbi:unnamed protein product [Dibothriocephalus latus]|uniref:Uncharacterized protein n=1 Tax=Dibothriocephalus latus TaxID=60516 RepID=A0A3P7PAE6_DIBLA|nr:unnamed protein product [Dibothriocephalus latus]